MTSLPPEPELVFSERAGLPFLVEHWYLGPRACRYMMVRRFREVLECADLAAGQRALDLGCGWAYGTLWARRLGAHLAGIDLGMDQLRWAHASLPGGDDLGLTCANAKALPFRDATFDRAFSVEMMEHVFRPDRPRVFDEIARVVKPGGRVAISTPNPDSPIEMVKRLAVRWPALRRNLPSSCFPESADDRATYHPYRYHHPLTVETLRGSLDRAGFEVLGARTFLWVLKTTPDALVATGRVMERIAEHTPVADRLGATILIWARRR